jgi:bacteriorhodopsin
MRRRSSYARSWLSFAAGGLPPKVPSHFVTGLGADRYYLAACLIATWASMADFAMLSGQGWTVTDGCRQFFYAR